MEPLLHFGFARGDEVLVANPRLMEGSKRRKRKDDRIRCQKVGAAGACGSRVVAPDHAPQSRGASGLGVAARAGGMGVGADGVEQHNARSGIAGFLLFMPPLLV